MSRDAAPRRDPKTGTWWFVVDVPPGPDGRRRQAKRRGFRTKAEAQAALDDLRVAGRQRAYVAPARQRLSDYLAQDWLPAIKASVEASTWASYERYLRLHVIPRIGGLRLESVDASTLNRLYGDLLERGRLDGKPGGLSPRTVRYIHAILGRALRDAVRWSRIVRNPAETAAPPSAGRARAQAPETRAWDSATLGRFLEAERASRYHIAWLFLATTGCRRGEALGLRWSDVDLDTGRASLRHTITAIDHQIHAASRTKAHRARVIELDAETVAALKTWRTRQAEERLLLGPAYKDRDLVFCHPDGRPYHPDRFSREFDRRVLRYHAPRIRLHDLRHTWATLALQAGVDVKIVSERLGHSTTTITRDIYQHVLPRCSPMPPSASRASSSDQGVAGDEPRTGRAAPAAHAGHTRAASRRADARRCRAAGERHGHVYRARPAPRADHAGGRSREGLSSVELMDSSTTATLVVAAGTLGLAGVALYQGLLARRSLALSIRPLLADAVPDETVQETVHFGAPGRFDRVLPLNDFYIDEDAGLFQCSIAFRNVGAGVAVVNSASAESALLGNVVVSKKFVPPGECVRVSVSAHADPPDPLVDAYHAGAFTLSISYSDADGRQKLVSDARIETYATSGTTVRRITVRKARRKKPFATSEPHNA
ncbi:MAG: tyrosine-type recombinase/integrase [Acidimicrobiia bacterium]